MHHLLNSLTFYKISMSFFLSFQGVKDKNINEFVTDLLLPPNDRPDTTVCRLYGIFQGKKFTYLESPRRFEFDSKEGPLWYVKPEIADEFKEPVFEVSKSIKQLTLQLELAHEKVGRKVIPIIKQNTSNRYEAQVTCECGVMTKNYLYPKIDCKHHIAHLKVCTLKRAVKRPAWRY